MHNAPDRREPQRRERNVGLISRFLLMLLAWGVSVPAAGDDSAATISESVRQLGAQEFRVRHAAARRLLQIGPAALGALQHAQQDQDPEVRARSRQLFESVRQSHYEQLLEELMRGATSSATTAGLPGWRKLTEITGDTPATRDLYQQMLRAEPVLLHLLDEDAFALRAEVQSRTASLQAGLRFGSRGMELEVRPEVLATLLLVTTSESYGTTWDLPEYLLRSPPLPAYDELREAEQWQPLRDLLAAWVVSPGSGALRARFSTARQLGLPEVIDPAREVLADPTLPVRDRQEAIVAIARFGGVEHIPDLEPLLADETDVVSHSRRTEVTFQSRLQDVALAALLHLTHQDPVQYGFGPSEGKQFDYNQRRIGFATDEARQSALRRWKTWRAVKLHSPLFGPLDAIEGTTL